jgi:hypothetical protein
MPANHADTQPLSKRIGSSVRQGAAYGSVTNAIVAAGDTMDLLDAGIATAGAALHADQRGHVNQVRQAIKKDQNITTANIAGLTTVDGLVALTDLGTGTKQDLLGD